MVNIKRILCPVDFSEFSRHALVRSVAIAREQNASITALHVVPIEPPLFVSDLEPYTPVLTLSRVDRERVLRKLTEFCTLDGPTGVTLEATVIEAPSVHGEILAQAGRLHADLIVMGTHGRSGFQRLLLGSVTEKVLRTAPQPVLTVGAPPAPGAVATSSFRHILCGVDFSECSVAALHHALSLAAGTDARVTIVNVVEWVPIGYDPLLGVSVDVTGYQREAETQNRQRLHKLLGESISAKREVEEIVTCGKPHDEILRIATEQNPDLIVLGIHGRNPIDRMLFGSTAERVVRKASCPVLTIRTDAPVNAAAA